MNEFFVYITGLIFGSFLSVVFSRLEIDEKPRRGRKRKEGIVAGRSRCDHCRREIAWYDNIPLVSYLLLRAKCRHCDKPISHYHPVLELCSGLFLLANYLYFGFGWQFVISSGFGLVMLLLFAYDLRHEIIPDKVVGPAIAAAVVLIIYQGLAQVLGEHTLLGLWSPNPWNHLLGGVVLGGAFLAMSLVSRGAWIGGGDVKLGLLIGLLLGWPYVLVAAIAAYLMGTLIAVALLAARRVNLKTMVPFGPMLVMGYFTAAYYGEIIIRWYQGWFL